MFISTKSTKFTMLKLYTNSVLKNSILYSQLLRIAPCRSYSSQKQTEAKVPRLKTAINAAVKSKELDQPMTAKELREMRSAKSLKPTKKEVAIRAQFLMDFAFVLRPYMKDYFSDINNLLTHTPKYLRERDIIAAFLGLQNIHQLDSPYIITKAVQRHLNENQPACAMHLCRMSPENSTIAMNHLLKYLCDTQKFSLVHKVYNNLKKWGVRPNERTFSVLTKAGLGEDKKLYKHGVEQLLKDYRVAMESTKSPNSKRIYTNSTLAAIARSSTPQNAIEFYESIPKSGVLARDAITYTTFLNFLAKASKHDEPLIASYRKKVWEEVRSRIEKKELKMDSKLMTAYLNALSISEAPEDFQKISSLVEKYYTYDSAEDVLSAKYKFTEAELDIVLRSALHTDNSQKALRYYGMLHKLKDVQLDLSCVHNFLRNFCMTDNLDFNIPKTLLESMVKAFKDGNEKMKPQPLTIHLVWTLFAKNPPADNLTYVEYLKNELMPELDIEMDREMLCSYITTYEKLSQSIYTPSPSVVVDVLKYVDENFDKLNIENSKPITHRHLRSAYQSIKSLSKIALNSDTLMEQFENKELDWIKNLKAKSSKMNADLKAKYPGSLITEKSLKEREINLHHEAQKELTKRYRRLREYNEVYRRKSGKKLDTIKLKESMKRSVHDEELTIPKSYELLELY